MSSHVVIGSVLGTAPAVFIKCGAFCVPERRLPVAHAAVVMFLANLATMTIGVLQAVAFAARVLLVGIPVLLLLAHIPAESLHARGGFVRWPRMRPFRVTLAAGFLPVASITLFASTGAALQRGIAAYRSAKFAFVVAALTFGMIVTTLWEEWVVYSLSRRHHQHTHYVSAVLRANRAALAVLMGVAAASRVAERPGNWGFLMPC